MMDAKKHLQFSVASTTHRLRLCVIAWLAGCYWFSGHLVAQTPVLIEGHVDIGVIYTGGALQWRFNADGATAEGGGLGALEGLYASSELYVRVPDSVQFISPAALPGNPAVTGSSETGMIWAMPSFGLPQVPFLGWSWDLAQPSPPQINLGQWQAGRITVELIDAQMPQNGNVSIWIGGTNYLSTFAPQLTNAPQVPSGSNSFILPSHDHFNWGFTAAGVYDLTVRASGTHLTDGYRQTEATFRFLVGDDTSPQPEASVTGVYVYHSRWSGGGEKIDLETLVAREGLGPQKLGLNHLSNSQHGINGLAVDIQGAVNPVGISSSDFVFQMSPQGAFDLETNSVATWQQAPAPSSLTVIPGETTRLIFSWPDHSIENRWMRATALPSPSTGLSAPAIFYIGHLRGETSDSSSDVSTVTFSDISAIRSGIGQTASVSSKLDIDKNGTVTFADISAMRANVGTQLTKVTVP
jgi:surface-anchored protein